MIELSLFEILTLFIGLLTAIGTIGSCMIALGIINLQRYRVTPNKYDFTDNNNIKIKITNKNSNTDLIIRNIYFTAKNREIPQFHLSLNHQSKDIDEMSVLPGSFYCFNSNIYQTIGRDSCGSYTKSYKTLKGNKSLKIADVIKEWKKKDKKIVKPQIYFDTNLGIFHSNPSRLAKKIWKKHLKNFS